MPPLTRNCRLTGTPFVISEWEQDFLHRMGDLPLPTLCPDERHRRRLAHRNERSIYMNKCVLTGKPIVSIFSPENPYKVYSQEAWHSDAWDAHDYGRDFDFNRPFFEQFAELQKAVPQLGLTNVNGENSDYCNITTGNKNCYLVFGGDFCEDCMYSVFSMHCRDVSDVYWVNRSELIYDSTDSENCYNLRYSQKCSGCRDSDFLFECKNCENCFVCVGLIGKKFHIFNEPYSEADYRKKIAEYHLETWSGVQKMKVEFEAFKLKFPHRGAQILNSENATGDEINSAKNVDNCFGIHGPAEDLKDVFLGGWGIKDCASSDHLAHHAELFYECLGSITGTHCAFNIFSWHSSNIFYSYLVTNSHDLFGCSNMKRAEYCILNKQYSPADYETLKAKIIDHMKKTGEWGEFFPIENSMFAYNETVAQDYFPLTPETAPSWKAEELRSIEPNKIPDSIHDVTDEILTHTFICQKTGRPYKIIPQELAFYRKMEVPVPQYAPETRNQIRIRQRNPIHLWDRHCAKCQAPIQTSYSPDRPEIVYCEACYLKTIY